MINTTLIRSKNWFSRTTLIVFLITLAIQGLSQPGNDDCFNAASLCSGQPISGSNIDATADTCAGCADDTTSWNNCFTPNNTVWFSFRTNANGGNATLNGNIGSCLSGGGRGDQLQAVIIEATSACDPSTYTPVSNCITNGSGNFSLNAGGLAPNTTYFVQVDGAVNGSATSPAECNFSLTISGQAVEFLADTSITDQFCGNTDGEIQVSNVSGGSSPYSFSLNGGAFQNSGTFSNLSAGTYQVTIQDDNGCTTTLENMTVQLDGGPDADTALTSASDCNNNTGTIEIDGISGGNPNYSFELNGSTTQSDSLFTNVPAGVHDVIITDQQGCTDTLYDIVVEDNSGITYAQEAVTAADCGTNNGEASVAQINGGTPPYSYQWDDPSAQTDSNATGLSPGSYNVTITDDNGCTFIINNVNVPEEPPDTATLSITPSQNPACVGEPVTFSADIVNGGSSPDLEWFVNGNSVQTGTNNTYTTSGLSDGDQVYCVFTNSDPCIYPDQLTSNTVTMSVEPNFSPSITLSSDKTNLCEGEVVNFDITSNNTGPGPIYRCYLNGSQVYSGNDSSFALSGIQDGDQVDCEVFSSHPCGDTATSSPINLSVTPFDPSVSPQSSTIFKGESVDITATGGNSYSWNPTSSLSSSSSSNTTASPEETTIYYVDIKKGVCDTTLPAEVIVEEPIIPPNTFTPNGDGKNDVWKIKKIERFPNVKVTVYDRWGQRVFNSTGYNKDQRWDGTKGGKKLPSATYYYVIDLNTDDVKGDSVFKGSITIIY